MLKAVIRHYWLAGLSEGSQPELQYEPTWQLSRQRCRRELLSVAQTGADQAQDLLDKRRSPQDLAQAREMVREAVDIYNVERPHHALKYRTPDAVHRGF